MRIIHCRPSGRGTRITPQAQEEETTSRSTADLETPMSCRAASITSRATGTQRPHCVLQPVRALRSRSERAPSSTAARIAESVTALQIQTYMPITWFSKTSQQENSILNANENHCQLDCGLIQGQSLEEKNSRAAEVFGRSAEALGECRKRSLRLRRIPAAVCARERATAPAVPAETEPCDRPTA
jgi:hypothetical protein